MQASLAVSLTYLRGLKVSELEESYMHLDCKFICAIFNKL